MSFKVVTAIFPEYIRIDAFGKYSLEHLLELIDVIKSEANNAGRDRVFIDPRDVDGGMTEADRFLTGRKIAEVFGPNLKAACIMRPEDITRLGELTAVNRGARFFVSDSEADALIWLLAN